MTDSQGYPANQPTEPVSPEYGIFERGILAVDRGIGVTEGDATGVIAVGSATAAALLTYYGVSHIGLSSVNSFIERHASVEESVTTFDNPYTTTETKDPAIDVISSSIAAVAVFGIVATGLIRGITNKAQALRNRI